MHLTRLRLRDLRNLAAVDLEPHPRFNVLAGENGQGKTNLLEGIYWLATLRPLRAARLRELVRFGAEATRVEGVVLRDGLEHRLSVAAEKGERVAEREGKRVKPAEYFGALAVVLFTPDDVGLVRGSPKDRRRYLDRAVFTGRPAHLADVLAYRRALDGRNRLLRDGAPATLFDAYEEALANAGARLNAARADFVGRLAPRFAAAFRAIAGDELQAAVRHRAGGDIPGDDVAAELRALWAEDRERDRLRGFTQRGPHTDDLELRLLSRSARAYASQGQQRAMVLALKIAEIEQLEAERGLVPVLLLDDVSSELDPRRNARLFEFLGGFEGQAFITTTDADFLRISAERRVFKVDAGEIRPQHQGSE